MINKYSVFIILAILSRAIPSLAEEQSNPSNITPAQTAPVVVPSPASAVPAAATPEAKRQSDIKAEKSVDELKEKSKPKASQKEVNKYMAKVAGLIATQARKIGSIGNGSATVSFRINESGSIDTIIVKSSTSSKYADAARRMLSGIHAGPPPGGSIALNQKFLFN